MSSAGVIAVDGMPATQPAIDAMYEKGINLTPHQSRCVTKDIIDAASLVVVMTKAQLNELRRRFPDAGSRICMMTNIASEHEADDIQDPIGCDLETYRETRDKIDDAVVDLILFMKGYQNGS